MEENTITFLVSGETFSFYANLDILEDSASFDSWNTGLYIAIGAWRPKFGRFSVKKFVEIKCED